MRWSILVVAVASLAGQPAPGRSVWVILPDRIVEYDAATFAARRSVAIPPRILEHPEYLAINTRGQLLFAAPSGVSFGGGELERTADRVWFWDSRAAREWTRDAGPDAPRQWFLSATGDVLYTLEQQLSIGRDRDGVERSRRIATRLRQTNLSGDVTREVLTLPDLPSCACTTGACSESCPVWMGWAPDQILGDFLLATRYVEGQLQPRYEETVIYRRRGATWIRAVLPEPIEVPLASTGDAAVLAAGVPDAACCGWINDSSDQLLVMRQGKRAVVYDEWQRFDNRNYDAGFAVSTARLAPSGTYLAYTVVADAPAADEEWRLSSVGKANPAELARIRAAAAEHPVVEIVDLDNAARPRPRISGAEAVGWLDAEQLLVAQNGRLAIYDRRGAKRRETAVAVRNAADAFIR